jgi:hypothetical protein
VNNKFEAFKQLPAEQPVKYPQTIFADNYFLSIGEGTYIIVYNKVNFIK